MKLPENINRRKVLKTLGTGLVGGTVLTGSATARGTVVSQINRDGHWAWFPLCQEKWGRQKHPYDFHEGESRWMAEPASGGAVRALAKNIGGPEFLPNRNTGFDIHMGPLGDLGAITVKSRTVQTQVGSEALLFIGLYLDENKNGEFFHWEKEKGDRESMKPGTGGDEEGLLTIDAGGAFTISEDTPFTLLVRGKSTTFGKLQNGEVDGIDGKTPAELYTGVIDKEEGGVEEAIIESVNIEKL